MEVTQAHSRLKEYSSFMYLTCTFGMQKTWATDADTALLESQELVIQT